MTGFTYPGQSYPGGLPSYVPAGPVTHDATGALAAQDASIAGTALRNKIHDATGVLIAQSASIAGTANRFRAFSAIGALIAQDASIAGEAARAGGAVTHDAIGALIAQNAIIDGSALRIVPLVTEQPIRNFDYDDYAWARIHRKKEVEEVIQQVALRQSEHLLTDEQKIYDELTRELELKGLEFEAIHLEALNYQRELLINAEIGRLLRLKLEDEEAILMLMAMMI